MRLDKFLCRHHRTYPNSSRQSYSPKRGFRQWRQANSGAQQISEQDQVNLDGETLELNTGFRYFLLNKPQGYVCANSDSLPWCLIY